MLKVVLVGFFTVGYLLMLLGIGRLIEQTFRTRFPVAFTMCLGMAGVIVMGGVLNFVGVAYPLVLDGLALAGVSYATATLFKTGRSKPLGKNLRRQLSAAYLARTLPSVILIAVVFGFSAHTLSSPAAFNIGDDMEKYLNHPVRMLSSGRLAGSQLNALGSETLGGQAFLQGFAAAHWPIQYVNSIDSVFSLTLCLMLVFSAALRAGLPGWMIPLIVALPVFINPQVVNISASYTASALILFLLLGPWLELKDREPAVSSWPRAVCIGLVYAALVALKSSFILLPLVHFSVLLLGVAAQPNRATSAFPWASGIIASSVGFLLPWGLLYFTNLMRMLPGSHSPRHPLPETLYSLHGQPPVNLFSIDPLFWGFGTGFAHYTITILLIGCCCLPVLLRKAPACQNNRALTAVAIAACITTPILYIVNIYVTAPLLHGPANGLRFLCPVIIAAAPAAFILTTATAAGTPGQRVPAVIGVITAMVLLILGGFSNSLAGRIDQALRYGSVLSTSNLARDPAYLAHNRSVLSSDARKTVRAIQRVIPKEKPLLAWTHVGFHLDYRRNPITDVDTAGLANPWADFPFGQRPSRGIAFLRNLGVDYVMWQYRGYGVPGREALLDATHSPFLRYRVISARAYQFYLFLEALTRQSEILYNDSSMLVMKLPPPEARTGPHDTGAE